jgi:predicted chitinase
MAQNRNPIGEMYRFVGASVVLLMCISWSFPSSGAQQACAAKALPLCPDPGVCFVTQQAQDQWAAENNCTFITMDMLTAVGGTDDSALGYLNKFAREYGVTTAEELAHFLSQVAHESGLDPLREENLDYRPARMRQIFGCKGGPKNYDKKTDDCTSGRLRPGLWTNENDYAHNPEKLGNYVYAGRNGNGDEASGDGYKYRGRGMIQLTGKANYKSFEDSYNALNPDDVQKFVDAPDLLTSDVKYGTAAAFYYWQSRGLDSLKPGATVCEVTKKVNGGTNGFDDRQEKFNSVGCLLGVEKDTGTCG